MNPNLNTTAPMTHLVILERLFKLKEPSPSNTLYEWGGPLWKKQLQEHA